eukprot:g11955.t4
MITDESFVAIAEHSVLKGLENLKTAARRFGAESAAVQAQLREGRLTKTVLQLFPDAPSPEAFTAGKATDLILHDGTLQPLAVLGGLRNEASTLDLLQSGYPSDHLLQMAAFTDLEAPRTRAAAAPRAPQGSSIARARSPARRWPRVDRGRKNWKRSGKDEHGVLDPR